MYTDKKKIYIYINLDLSKILSMELLFKILENKMQTEKPVVEGLKGTLTSFDCCKDVNFLIG